MGTGTLVHSLGSMNLSPMIFRVDEPVPDDSRPLSFLLKNFNV